MSLTATKMFDLPLGGEVLGEWSPGMLLLHYAMDRSTFMQVSVCSATKV